MFDLNIKINIGQLDRLIGPEIKKDDFYRSVNEATTRFIHKDLNSQS